MTVSTSSSLDEAAYTLKLVDEAYDDLAAIRNLLREAKALGARFRLSGYDVEIDGLDDLPDDLQAKLARHCDNGLLWCYLGGEDLDNRSLDLADELCVEVALIETRAAARRAVRTLIADAKKYTDDGAIGFDIETMPLPEYFKRTWIKLNKDGGLAAHQPKPEDGAGLNPHTSTIATMQFYAGGTHCFVFRGEALRLVRDSHWLRRQRLIIHNAVFELKFLGRECRDYRPPPHRRTLSNVECTAQAVGLTNGVGFGGENRSLANAAKARLRGLDVPKDLQVSDWGAARLSPGQLAYAACDSVVAHRLWPGLRKELCRKRRWSAYELQKRAAPATADMELRGIAFDLPAHKRQVEVWSRDLADARKEFARLTGDPPPHTQNEIRAWLERTLDASVLARWPRTEKERLLSVSIDAIKTIAQLDSARAVIDILNREKLLSTFGPSLADKVNRVTGRLHPSFNLAAVKSGRFSASDPNFQQTPNGKRAPGFRNCFVAAPGRVLVGADYNQIELRALGEVYQNRAIRRVYAETDPAKRDLHRLTAAQINKISPEAVTDDQRARAKAVNFGMIYGMGARGLVGYAYSSYGVVLTEFEAQRYIDTFFNTFYPLKQDLYEHDRLCRGRRGSIVIGAGRVVEAGWEKYGLSRQQTYNLPIQGIAADCMLRALRWVYDKFRSRCIRGGLIATVHDEIIVEVAEKDAEDARDLLEACMLGAFAETFPKASLAGVVEAKIGKTWGELK
jgi:DNA polymerase-1